MKLLKKESSYLYFLGWAIFKVSVYWFLVDSIKHCDFQRRLGDLCVQLPRKGKNNQTKHLKPRQNPRDWAMCHFSCWGHEWKQQGVSVIPVTARVQLLCERKEQHTLDVSAWQRRLGRQNTCAHICECGHRATQLWPGSGFPTRTKAYLQIRLLASTPALMSYVRDVDDDQISSHINF